MTLQSQIIASVKRGQSFTQNDFPHVGTRVQVRGALVKMRKRGDLVIVTKPQIGRYSERPTVYALKADANL